MSIVKRLPRLIFLLALTIPLSAGIACAKEKQKEKKIDFSKTRGFLGEMQSRPDFPVSMVLANDYAYSMLATGNIEPARKDAIIAYMKNAQQKNGGFIGDKANKAASLLYTDFAVETLGYLNATNAVDTGRIRSFVASLRNPDGGFGYSEQAKESSLATTYYAVRVLNAIGALDAVDRAKTAAYVKAFERTDGGFGFVKGTAVANAKNTYQAVATLETLGALDDATVKKSVRYLGTTPYVKGKSKQKPELEDELYTLKALKVLKASDRIDKKFATLFMKRLYIPVNGGFGPMEGYGSTPDSTAAALRVLSEIGTLKGVGTVTVAKK
jgi:hypothetical protein